MRHWSTCCEPTRGSQLSEAFRRSSNVTPNVTLTDEAPVPTAERELVRNTHQIEYERVRIDDADVWTSMNRFGGADLLIHSCAHGGLDARHGRHFDLTHRGDVVAVGL